MVIRDGSQIQAVRTTDSLDWVLDWINLYKPIGVLFHSKAEPIEYHILSTH